MLKIGTVKWQGKCSSHPKYDPSTEGPDAIERDCSRCHDLFTIYQHHRLTLRLMRSFAPPRRRPPADLVNERQQSLFA